MRSLLLFKIGKNAVYVHRYETAHGNNQTGDLQGAMALLKLLLSAATLTVSLVSITLISQAAVSHLLPPVFYKRISCYIMSDISFYYLEAPHIKRH
jgi:hypothetical protein